MCASSSSVEQVRSELPGGVTFASAEDTADSERWCECACLRMRALGSRLSMETGWLTITVARVEAMRGGA